MREREREREKLTSEFAENLLDLLVALVTLKIDLELHFGHLNQSGSNL